MTTRRCRILGMLLVAIGALTPTDAHAKHCGTACSAEIASCQVTCTLGGRWARRRCRGACKRSIIASCRAYDGPECVDPATSSTVPDTTTTTTTTAPLASTSTTSEPGILTTTSTTLPGDPVPTGFFPTMHVTSSQVDRTYSLFVPPSYDPNRAYPIVFAFHGDGGTGADVWDALALEAQASGAAIFVYPDATEESGRHWTLDASLNSNPDMLFFLDIITQLSAVYRLDETQRFATGLSSGAYFVNFLNCTLGTTYLRAIAPHSGSGPYGPPGSYDQDGHFECAAQPAAAMLIHGTIDDVVPLSDAEYSHQQWVWGNHCADTSSNGPGPAPCVEHDACDPGRPVDWCAVPGLGHEVWGLAPQAIWGFFARFLDRPPPPPGGATMKVMGRDLYDADGEKVVLRGVNKMNVFDPNDHDGSVSFPDIHATGANTVRIVWMTRTAFFVPTAQDLDTVIGNAIAHQLVPMIELHDATGNLALVSSPRRLLDTA
jgi:polyhydroxybutyrate depolymerase